jgi:uncharacterized surface protein with fasciclin (FAS1) repeats
MMKIFAMACAAAAFVQGGLAMVPVSQLTAGREDLTLLAAALSAAGIEELPDDITVFAPNDEAFKAVIASFAIPDGEDALAYLTSTDEGLELIKQILSYHVVPGVVAKSTDLTDGMVLQTLLPDATLVATLNDEGVFINDAQVIEADLMGEEATYVAHVIDAVLTPPALAGDAEAPAMEAPSME